MKICLIHGFNVKDGGAHTVDMLAPYLEARGHEIDKDEADYGYHNLIKVRFYSKAAVKRIAGAMEKADVALTHSNGANYAMQAAYLISSPIIIVHVSAALNRKVNIPAVVSHMRVMYSNNDKAVKFSRILRFGHPWGAMGAYGYEGEDTRAVNEDHTAEINGHSDWFTKEKAPRTANQVADILESL